MIFDDRQYIAYRVHPTKRIQISLYSSDLPEGTRYSGTFTATFTCYDPYGRMLRTELDTEPSESELSETGLLSAEMTPEIPTADSSFFLLYNPGTEVGHSIIRLTGDVGEEGVLIRNLTTGQKCKVVNLKASSLQQGACLELDSEKCQTRIVLGDEIELAFPFHDEGYITLAPCLPFVRSIAVSHTTGSNRVSSDGAFAPHMKGQYLYIDGWKCIRQVTDMNTAILSETVNSTGTSETPVVTMNEIEITGGEGLTRFEVECKYRSR